MADEKALVIGGGVAGLASASRLARNGLQVYLLERDPTLGGHAASFACKATDRCTKCSVCIVPDKLLEVTNHPRISLLTNSDLISLSGTTGNFEATIMKKPAPVDAAKCTACGVCSELCPVQPIKAISPMPPGAAPRTYLIDRNRCLRFTGGDCKVCQDNCPSGAINLQAKAATSRINVGAIVVATGFEPSDAREAGLLGYGRYPNVFTGLDLERMFASGAPFVLPSTGKPPQNVAFIQCVGSRNEYIGSGYCSQVCCKYAIRFASLMQHQNPEAKVTVYYMDLQTAGKGFGEFYEKSKGTIRFVRGIPVEVNESGPGQLAVRYEDLTGAKVARENYDLVVLSVGIAPGTDSWHLARILGINLGEFGFLDTQDPADTSATNVEGIFLAGACQGPKDIPESIAHGVQAASRVLQTLRARAA